MVCVERGKAVASPQRSDGGEALGPTGENFVSVRLTTARVGLRDSNDPLSGWVQQAGEVVDVPETTAEAWIRDGQAVAVSP
jgi:hypothetical protein